MHKASRTLIYILDWWGKKDHRADDLARRDATKKYRWDIVTNVIQKVIVNTLLSYSRGNVTHPRCRQANHPTKIKAIIIITIGWHHLRKFIIIRKLARNRQIGLYTKTWCNNLINRHSLISSTIIYQQVFDCFGDLFEQHINRI